VLVLRSFLTLILPIGSSSFSTACFADKPGNRLTISLTLAQTLTLTLTPRHRRGCRQTGQLLFHTDDRMPDHSKSIKSEVENLYSGNPYVLVRAGVNESLAARLQHYLLLTLPVGEGPRACCDDAGMWP